MSETAVLDRLPLFVVAIIGLLVLIIGGLAIYYAFRQMEELTAELRDVKRKMAARDKQIDECFSKLAEQISSKDPRGTLPLRDTLPVRNLSSEVSNDKDGITDSSRAQQSTAPSSGTPMSTYAEPQLETVRSVLEAATRALESASSCNRFAEDWKATGFAINADGKLLREPIPSPDRGDILVLAVCGRDIVVPSFNMKRSQGLYTSDAGRAAQMRLGWLFEIEHGERLVALQAAEIGDNWAVIKKGRLALPLGQC